MSRSNELSSVRRSVVKVFVRASPPNWTSPWQRRPQRGSSGSGFCVGDRQVLTNAHVVSDAVLVRVRRYGDAVRYPAKVVCVSPQVDLALLEVPDPAFWESPPALAAVDLSEEVPALDADVVAVGYPMGGENLCVTRGVVSRIDLMDYTFSPVGGERQLVIQVDAAINPGNSGGPVLDAFGRVLGVAFAAMRQGASIGYVIPGSVVRFFLKAAAASAGGAMDSSLCALGVRLQPARAPALRAVRGLDQGSGALIAEVAPLSAAAAAGVEAGDVLLAVDGVPVAEDCTVPFRDAERIGFDFLISRRVAGDAMRLQIWRGAEKELQLLAAPLPQLVPRTPGVDARPSYLVVGGLVFTRLTLPWLLARFSEEVRKAPAELQAKLWEHKEHADQEVVVLAKVLSADLNYGYEEFQCCELLRFGAGGTPVRSLKQLRAEVLAALRGEGEGGPAAYLRFCFSFNLEIVLDAEQCRTSHNEILRQYGIHQDCSSDLMDNSEIRSKL